MCKSGIFDTKQAMSLKRSSLEPKLLQGVYRNSCTACDIVYLTRHRCWWQRCCSSLLNGQWEGAPQTSSAAAIPFGWDIQSHRPIDLWQIWRP